MAILGAKMIGVRKHRNNDGNGERFTLTVQDPSARNPGYRSDFADLTENEIREMLGLIGEPDAVADRLLQNARAEFRATQHQST
jgi:hypothetical protein